MEVKKRGLTRDIIGAAAIEIVEQKGFPQLSIQELASVLQVKPASLYNHISGIDDLRIYMAQFALEKLEEALRDAAVGHSHEEALRKIAHAYRRFALKRPELYKTFMSSAHCNDEGVAEAKLSIMRIFHQVLEPHCLDHKTRIHLSRCFRSGLHGFVSLESAGFFKKGVNSNESFDALVENLLGMLRNYALQKGAEECT